MTDDSKVQDASSADVAKLVVAILLVAAGIVGYYLLDNVWLRWGCVVAGLALGALVIALSGYGKRLWAFTESARVELRKVVWPSRTETFQTTYVVIGFAIVMGLFFFVLDWILTWMTRLLGGTSG